MGCCNNIELKKKKSSEAEKNKIGNIDIQKGNI